MKRNPHGFDLGFVMNLEEGYNNVIVSKTGDPGDSEVTPKEKDLIKDIKFLDRYMEYRESVHGKKSNVDTVTLDSLKSLGKISMPPVNTLSTSTNLTYHSSDMS